jgi:hypothetical protein
MAQCITVGNSQQFQQNEGQSPKMLNNNETLQSKAGNASIVVMKQKNTYVAQQPITYRSKVACSTPASYQNAESNGVENGMETE